MYPSRSESPHYDHWDDEEDEMWQPEPYRQPEEEEEDGGWYAPRQPPAPRTREPIRQRQPQTRRASLLGGSAVDTLATAVILGGVVWFGWYTIRSYQSGGEPIYGNGGTDEPPQAAADGGARIPPPPEEVQVGDVGGRPRFIPAPLEAGAVNNLPVQVSIVVPSTRGAEDVSTDEFKRRIDRTKRWFSSHFGGDTTVRGQGDYVDEDDNLISENVAIVESSMSVGSYQQNVDDLAAFIVEKRDEWDQDTVLYKVEDQVFIYPERDYIDDTAYPSNIVEVI